MPGRSYRDRKPIEISKPLFLRRLSQPLPCTLPWQRTAESSCGSSEPTPASHSTDRR
ncbi:rCG63008 [Rattus norvegicus]|uniref:RCG63008 n=1 Tax=Rattus norvegicus TaxID=10116 RepID=A6ISG3_RAT|nr:rCG63008 [Rattus norvegicus]